MKRRGFRGIMGGAVVAGPGAAKQAVTAASHSMSGGVAKLGVGMLGGEAPTEGGMSVGLSHKSWLLEKVAKYQRILSGDLTDEEIEERKVDSNARLVVFEIETSGLRSMSESSKFARMNRQDKRLRAERDRFYAKRTLNNCLKELAGME